MTDKPLPPQPYLAEWDKRIVAFQDEIKRLHTALDESVKLQSHYAAVLNDYDGGYRMLFANAQAWMDRIERGENT